MQTGNTYLLYISNFIEMIYDLHICKLKEYYIIIHFGALNQLNSYTFDACLHMKLLHYTYQYKLRFQLHLFCRIITNNRKLRNLLKQYTMLLSNLLSSFNIACRMPVIYGRTHFHQWICKKVDYARNIHLSLLVIIINCTIIIIISRSHYGHTF